MGLMVAFPLGSGLYANQNPPHYITGAYYPPAGLVTSNTAIAAVTATRCYYFPFAIWEPHTFTAAMSANGGAADNGKKYRCMIFNDNGATGGPGTLAKDFGEVTLTGAGADRTLTSNWAALPGIYWGAMWFETNPAMLGFIPSPAGIGGGNGPALYNFIGSFNTPSAMFGNLSMPTGHYVDTAYGAAPATAVAPNASVNQSYTSVTTVLPGFVLKA